MRDCLKIIRLIVWVAILCYLLGSCAAPIYFETKTGKLLIDSSDTSLIVRIIVDRADPKTRESRVVVYDTTLSSPMRQVYLPIDTLEGKYIEIMVFSTRVEYFLKVFEADWNNGKRVRGIYTIK